VCHNERTQPHEPMPGALRPPSHLRSCPGTRHACGVGSVGSSAMASAIVAFRIDPGGRPRKPQRNGRVFPPRAAPCLRCSQLASLAASAPVPRLAPLPHRYRISTSAGQVVSAPLPAAPALAEAPLPRSPLPTLASCSAAADWSAARKWPWVDGRQRLQGHPPAGARSRQQGAAGAKEPKGQGGGGARGGPPSLERAWARQKQAGPRAEGRQPGALMGALDGRTSPATRVWSVRSYDTLVMILQ